MSQPRGNPWRWLLLLPLAAASTLADPAVKERAAAPFLSEVEATRRYHNALKLSASTASTAETTENREQLSKQWLKALTKNGIPRFLTWPEESEVFDTAESSQRASSNVFPGKPSVTTGEVAGSIHGGIGGPLIHFIHYNPVLTDYIRQHSLQRRQDLASRLHAGRPLPALPATAMVVMTAWWPLAADRSTPLPIWDPAQPTRPEGANGYLSWPRVASLAPANGSRQGSSRAHHFAGRNVDPTLQFAADAMYLESLSAEQAQRLMQSPEFEMAASVVLGRPLQAGDAIALVGLHFMHAGLTTGIWGTYWWQPPEPAPARGNSLASLPAPWMNYRGDLTTDSVYPREVDGTPTICFNPWFDAVFADSGAGNGLRANCVSCHLRAGYPARGALEVTRGQPMALPRLPQQLNTRMLWSLTHGNQRRNEATPAESAD